MKRLPSIAPLIAHALVVLAPLMAEAAGQITGLTAAPSPGTTGNPETVTVTGSGTCGNLTLDFGDGSTTALSNVTLPKGTPHTYKNPGTFTLRATAVSSCAGQASAAVTVKAPPPSGGLSSTGSPATASGSDPFVGIDGTVYHTGYPVAIAQQGTLYFVNVFTGNNGNIPINNYFTVNLTVSDAAGKSVCSTGTNVTVTVPANSNFTALRFQVRKPSTPQTVPYTLYANFKYWQTPSDPTANLHPENDQAQATVNLPSGGTLECVVASPPQIQSVSVTPALIPGGQEGYGTILLKTPPPVTVTVSGGTTTVSNTLSIQLSSNKPQVASVPASVSLAYPNLSASFPIQTVPVATSQTATISATPQVAGSEPFGTNVTVRPPQLADLQCVPNQVASGTPIHCKVLLDGKVAGRPIVVEARRGNPPPPYAPRVQISTSNAAIASYPGGSVTVWPGQDQAPFDIPTSAVSQTAPVTISASYQGVTKSAPVQLTAALIKDFGCYTGNPDLSRPGASTCTITPWSGVTYGFIVHLTSAQANQVTIPLSEPGRHHHASQDYGWIPIPAGQTAGVAGNDNAGRQAWDYFEPVPTTENHTVRVRDPVSGTTLTTSFTVLPAQIVRIGFGDPLSAAKNPATISSLLGQKVKVWVSFNAPPAPTDWNSQNAWLDIRYGGNVGIQGPTNLAIREQDCQYDLAGEQCVWRFPTVPYVNFDVTLGACSAAVHPNGCQATVSVSSHQALGSQTGTINVTPQ